MPSELKNYYDILGLDFFESNAGNIKNSYRKATEKFHPNSYSSPDLKIRLVEINEAFLVLSDPYSKKLYDAALSADSNVDLEKLDCIIKDNRERASFFVDSYFNGTQKKKKSVWKIIGIILLSFFVLGSIGRIIVATRDNTINTPNSYNSNYTSAKKLGNYNPPANWTYYKIDDSFSLYVPPTLELRTEYDRYTHFLSEHHIAVSNADAVFQQKNLSTMSKDGFSTYCRILAERYYVGPDNAERHNESPSLISDDYRELRSIADAELGPWTYIQTPRYEWIDINGTKAIDISYSREGTKGEVICHIYLFFNYDEIAKIITSYRQVDKNVWASDINNVIRTFKWSNPK